MKNSLYIVPGIIVLLLTLRIVLFIVDYFTSISRWHKGSSPDLNAKIISMKTRKALGRRAFRTKVCFDDGYLFYFFRSKVEMDFMSQFTPTRRYTVSVELDTKV